MSFKEFKCWESIDGTAVRKQEIDASFSMVMEQAKAIEAEYISRTLKIRSRRLSMTVAAAAAAVLLVVTPLAAYLYLRAGTEDRLTECSVPMGEIKEITLADGSKVTLNAGSTLSYPEEFGQKRIVKLSGEATFNVTASKTHPFIVKTDDICVTAHGTVFNVCDYPSDLTACATLCSGKIGVSRTRSDDKEILLAEDHVLTYEKSTGATVVTYMKGDEATSWKNGDLIIRSMKLEQVMKVIERKFDITVHLTTDKYVNATLTAKFINNESLVEIMDAFRKLLPGMEYVIEDDNIYIR